MDPLKSSQIGALIVVFLVVMVVISSLIKNIAGITDVMELSTEVDVKQNQFINDLLEKSENMTKILSRMEVVESESMPFLSAKIADLELRQNQVENILQITQPEDIIRIARVSDQLEKINLDIERLRNEILVDQESFVVSFRREIDSLYNLVLASVVSILILLISSVIGVIRLDRK